MKDKYGNEHDERNGRFTSNGSTEAENKRAEELTSSKMSTTDKIESVHIDPTKDNIFPELNDSDLEKIGVDHNKPVLLKKSIIERNRAYHSDIDLNESNKIIGEAIYNPAKIFKGNKEGYFIFAQIVRVSSKTGEPRYGTVLVDVNETLKNFEIVHWHIMIPKELDKAENKNK